MKWLFSALVFSASFLPLMPTAYAGLTSKSDEAIARSKCVPMQISGEKEKTICSMSLAVILARSFQTFCKKGEVCITQTKAFTREVLGQTLYILERDLPKKGYQLKLSAAVLYRMIDMRWAVNSDENSVALLTMFLSPYVVAVK